MGVLYSNCRTVREKVNGWFTARFGDRGVSRKYNNANFARALAMGLASGMPLEDAAELAGKLLEDTPAAAQRCCQCSVLLRDGAPLADAMKECGFLAAAESRMLIIGMRQGSGDLVMANIADRLMEQADEALENTVAKIEPAMVLIASVLVGAIMLSVMLPLMNIMAAIG
jgi:type IV pilus assembly protein PilC